MRHERNTIFCSDLQRRFPRRQNARLVEELEPRTLLHGGPAAGLRRIHPPRIPPVAMVMLPGGPTGIPFSPPPNSGASVNANSSTVIIPFLDKRGVLNVYDSLHNRVVNTGQAARSIQVDALNENVFFLTPETVQGKDLDRDGLIDSNDTVLQFYNVGTGKLTNTHFQVAGSYTANTGSLTPLVAFLISEPAAARDFNNNGNTHDNVAVVYNVLNHRLMNTHREAESFNFSNNIMTFVTNEAKQGQDLNGDGKIQASDNVLEAFDPLSFLPNGLLINLGKTVNGL